MSRALRALVRWPRSKPRMAIVNVGSNHHQIGHVAFLLISGGTAVARFVFLSASTRTRMIPADAPTILMHVSTLAKRSAYFARRLAVCAALFLRRRDFDVIVFVAREGKEGVVAALAEEGARGVRGCIIAVQRVSLLEFGISYWFRISCFGFRIHGREPLSRIEDHPPPRHNCGQRRSILWLSRQLKSYSRRSRPVISMQFVDCWMKIRG
jgi:hypothetical protein